jgi:hypothetical protein
MAYLRPGVYVEETLTPIPSVVGSDATSVAAFLGATDKGPTAATLVTSWTQYTTLYGSWGTNNTLTTGVYLFFANGGGQCYIGRVTGSGAAAATRTINDRNASPASTLIVNAANAGVWGNSTYITITDSTVTGYFDLTVTYAGTASSNIVERFTDLTMNPADARYAPSVINASSNYITVTDANPSNTFNTLDNPALTSNQALASGSDGTAVTTAQIVAGTSKFDSITNALVLNAPGVTGTTDVNALITYAENRGDVFVVIDGSVSGGADVSVTTQMSNALAYTASSLAAVYYPSLTIPNPTSYVAGATSLVPAGAAVIGQYVSTDASRGVFKAPAGLTARLSGAVSVIKISNADLDTMNSASKPVNAIRYIPGSGIVIMGARTLKAGYADRYVPVRRSLIYLKKALNDLTQFAIFEPNDERLWRELTATTTNFLTDFWQQGGLRGASPDAAFYVRCNADNNPSSSIANGEVHIEVGVALQRPAEFVVIRISQYDSGAVVTVA